MKTTARENRPNETAKVGNWARAAKIQEGVMGFERRRSGKAAGFVAGCGVIGILCAGCAGVVPLPKRTHTPQGIDENVHLDFLHAGQTSREEVREKLKAFDTGVESERYFVGRWTSSTWAWFVVAQGGGAGDRHWSTKNLLIEFDEKALVKGFRSFSDKDLSSELGPIAEEYKHPEASDRTELVVKARALDETPSARIILSCGNLEFAGVGPRKRPTHFTIGADNVSSISSVGGAQVDAAYCEEMIRFAEVLEPLGGPKGRKVHVRIKLPDLVTLLGYIHANGGKVRAGG